MSLGMVDTLMLSRISDASVAACGLMNQILNMIFLVFIVGAQGALVVCSQYLGARRVQDFLETAKVALFINTLIGVVISALLFFGADVIVNLMQIQKELAIDAQNYCKIVGGFAFLSSLTFATASILRSREMAKYPMYVSLITNIVNILANYVLIFGHLGFEPLHVEGAAWATVLSRLIGVILLLFILFRVGISIKKENKFIPNPIHKLVQILKIGIPGAGEMFSYSLSQVVIVYFINMLGTEAIAARTYIMNIVFLTFIFAISIAQGSSIICGRLVGKHKFIAAQNIGEYSINKALLISVLLSTLLAIFSPYIVENLTQNQAIAKLCLTIFWIDIVVECGRAVNILTGRLLGAVGDPLFPLKVSIIVVWLVATFGSYIFGIFLGFGLIGMWCVFLCDESLRAIIQWYYWKKGYWKNKSIC